MTANVYLVKIAEMNKAAGDADDNKPSIGRGALTGAGVGAGVGALAGVGVGRHVGNEMLKEPAGGLRIGRKVRYAALEGLQGKRLEGDHAPFSRVANRMARGSKTVGEYLVKHPVKGARAIFTGVTGLAGMGLGAGAGATSGASIQGVRRLMDKEASENRYLVKIAAEYSKDNPYTEPMDATIGRHATMGAKIGAGVGGVVGAGLGAVQGHPIAGAIGGALGGGLQFGLYGAGTGLLTGAYNAHKREAWEKAHRKVAAEYSPNNPHTGDVRRQMTAGETIGALGGAGLGAILMSGSPRPNAITAGAIGGAMAGYLPVHLHNLHEAGKWEKAHRKVAEEIPGYFNTVGRWAGKGGEVGGVVGSVVGGIDGTVEGLRRGKGVVGKAVGVAKEGLKHSIILGGVGGGLGGAVGGTMGGVAGTVNLGRKGVRVVQDAAK